MTKEKNDYEECNYFSPKAHERKTVALRNESRQILSAVKGLIKLTEILKSCEKMCTTIVHEINEIFAEN